MSWALALTLAWACGGPAQPDIDPEAIPEIDLFTQPVADAPNPADRAGAAAHHVDCAYGIAKGGWSQDFGPPAGASDAEGALARFLGDGLFDLPEQGYRVSARDEGRILFTYPEEGTPKVAVIVAETGTGWVVETFASCDPAEYDSSVDDQLTGDVWLDAEGNRVPTTIVTSFPGAAHCGWQSVTYLIYQGRQYISDPKGVMDVPFVAPYEDDAELPPDAVDTGYRHEGWELWLSADGDVAYLRSDVRVEAWPQPDTPNPVWCA